MLALTEAERLGLFSLAGVVITGCVAVIVALIQSRRRANRSAASDADAGEVEEAWEQRGRLIVGMRHDVNTALSRIAALEKRAEEAEAREERCLDSLEWAYGQIAALQERLGVKPIERRPRHHNDT